MHQTLGLRRHKVVAIVATYNPDVHGLASRLESLRSQVAEVVIVDDGSLPEAVADLNSLVGENVHLLVSDANRGVAKAQNAGLDWARRVDAAYVLLMDQDSEAAPSMVHYLLAAAELLTGRGVQLAAVGPTFSDDRRGPLNPFARIQGLRIERFGCLSTEELVPTLAMISSGTLIPLPVLNKIGGMTEELFIDLVDIEWCLRARARGYECFGVCKAVLHHSLGEQPHAVLNRKITHHRPLRNYYFFRNAVWLSRQAYVPLAWKLSVAGQLLRRGLVYPLAVAPRWSYLRMMSLGLWHGFRGRLGRLD